MADAMSQAFSSAEGMVSLGGAIVVAGYLLFELILREYFLNWTTVMLCVVAILIPRVSRSFVEKIASVPVLMKAVGYLIVILAVLEILYDLRHAGTVFDEFLGIIGALVTYVGYAIVFMGARSIKT